MAGQGRNKAFLDSLWARGLALLVAAAAAGALVYIHRDDVWPTATVADADDPFYACFAERAADIDKLLAEGTITGPQALQFKGRAEAMCRDRAGGNNQVPLPGQ
jgi:hypothetical protein